MLCPRTDPLKSGALTPRPSYPKMYVSMYPFAIVYTGNTLIRAWLDQEREGKGRFWVGMGRGVAGRGIERWTGSSWEEGLSPLALDYRDDKWRQRFLIVLEATPCGDV